MSATRRDSASAYLARFHQAVADWMQATTAGAHGRPNALADALRVWIAARPEDAHVVQRLAVGTAATCVVGNDLAEAARVVAAGLDASILGAPSAPEHLTSATWLALLGARVAYEMDDVAHARALVDRARETTDGGSGTNPLDRYLQLHRYLIEARLAEAALEVQAARDAYVAATDLAATLEDAGDGNDLLTAWSALVFGPVAQLRTEAAGPLLRQELGEAGLLAALGLGRTSSQAGSARDAIDRCVVQGLPVAESVLALSGLLERLPSGEIDDAADRLAAVIDDMDEPSRANWLLALRAFQADAWVVHRDLGEAQRALALAGQADPAHADGLAFMTAFASRAKAEYLAGDATSGWSDVEKLLRLRAGTAAQLSGSRLELRSRAACEPALAAAVAVEAAGTGDRTVHQTRRRTAALIDAMRSAEDAPVAARSETESDSGLERAAWLAGDRFARLAYRVADATAGELMVLVVQNVGDELVFMLVAADHEAIVITDPSTHARRSLASLASAAERAVVTPTSDDVLVKLGRAAFDALPAPIRAGIRRASTIVIVPDFGSGRDRTPFELLHDGDAFLGVTKVMCRCLSVAHALRVLEPPLVAATTGRRALCVAVAAPPGMAPLPHAATEVSRVVDALGWGSGTETLFESDADPDLILELAPLADVLHLACHGDSAAGAEALVLADGKRLRALDIVTRHRLSGVTYLNACSLGAGRYVGGGVSRGVAYAFARAGSPTVVANLLPVADHSAADLAEAFYTEARDHPVGEAVRRARETLSGRVSAALWSTTVLLGDPDRHLDGTRDASPDQTGELFAGEPTPSAERLDRARAVVATDPTDIRLAAAVELSAALADDETRLVDAADVARELGHDVGEAQFLLSSAAEMKAAGDVDRHARRLRGAVGALEPLRGKWSRAYDEHRRAAAELRALDPAYHPRQLETFRFDSGLTVNDRTDPAVDFILRLNEAQFEHENFWRGEPTLIVPDVDVTSLAHNALVWGYLNRLAGTGAESAYALASAERLVWRGVIAEHGVPHVHRIWAGLLSFLWGQQYVTHLHGWMLRAHTWVLEIAVARVNEFWLPASSPALPYVAELGCLLDGVDAPAQPISRFARARTALQSGGGGGPSVEEVASGIEQLIERCGAVDGYAAADLGAWIVGDILERERVSTDGTGHQRSTALTMRTLLERLAVHEEDWIAPYLMDGFTGERETAGTDLLDRWSNQVL